MCDIHYLGCLKHGHFGLIGFRNRLERGQRGRPVVQGVPASFSMAHGYCSAHEKSYSGPRRLPTRGACLSWASGWTQAQAPYWLAGHSTATRPWGPCRRTDADLRGLHLFEASRSSERLFRTVSTAVGSANLIRFGSLPAFALCGSRFIGLARDPYKPF